MEDVLAIRCPLKNNYYRSPVCRLLVVSVIRGHTHCTRRLAAAGNCKPPLRKALNKAIAASSLSIVDAIYHATKPLDEHSQAIAVGLAAEHDRMDCLRLFRENEFSVEVGCLRTAIRHDRLECLKFMFDMKGGALAKARLSAYSTCNAIENGAVRCTKYLVEVLGLVNSYALSCAIKTKDLTTVAYIHNYTELSISCSRQAVSDRKCLEYVYAHDCPWDATVTAEACHIGDLAVLRFLREHGCPWDAMCLTQALINRDTEMVKYILGNKGPHSTNAMPCAVESKNLDLVKMLHEYGCEFSDHAIRLAVSHSTLDILKYIERNRGPMTTARDFGFVGQDFAYILYLDQVNLEGVRYVVDKGNKMADLISPIFARTPACEVLFDGCTICQCSCHAWHNDWNATFGAFPKSLALVYRTLICEYACEPVPP